MSYTDNVANFLGSLGSFYETVPKEDLEMLVGNIIQKVSSREASPQRSDLDQLEVKVNGLKPTPVDTDSEADDEEEFIDTVEVRPLS